MQRKDLFLSVFSEIAGEIPDAVLVLAGEGSVIRIELTERRNPRRDTPKARPTRRARMKRSAKKRVAT